MLELRGVSRTYGGRQASVHALRDVDLDVERGEFVAVVGPSGGGKTTLLSILGCLDAPTAGEYRIDGRPVPVREGGAIAVLRARTFGFVFQSFHLLDQRAAADSVELGLLYLGVPRRERTERAVVAAAQVGMADRLSTRAALLSGGQRQRLAIARATATDAPVVLADEPTGNLDSHSGARVMAELTRLHQAGATLIVVTHSAEVAALAQRVVHIADGRVVEAVPDARARAGRHEGEAVGAGGPRSPAPRGRLRARDVVRDAAASLRSRVRQTVALGLTVALTVGLLVTTLGFEASTRAQVASTFDAHANREVTVSWTAGSDAPAHAPEPVAAVRAVHAMPGVTAVAAVRDFGDLPVGAPRGGVAASPLVVPVQVMTGQIAAATGSTVHWAGPAGMRRTLSAGEAVVGVAVADRLLLGPLAASPVIQVAGRMVTVVGIIESSDRMPELAGSVVVSPADAPAVAPNRNRALIVTRAGAAQQVGARVPLVLDAIQPKQYQVERPVDPRTLRQEVQGGLGTALAGFTALSALVAVLALANAVAAAVGARRSELGLRRALGARAGQLAGLVMTEAGLLGLAGGAVGLAAGFATILTFTIAHGWMPVFDVRLAPLAVVAGGVIGCASAIVGAVRAARVRPADALRQ
ncbi:ATP-binding cassette domain-containing protein [Microbacterium sp.]|uniref:ABC transporter ATP-binding protein/permease n=1 Tax=Microbacterium sp. TaxID=51671 RepID=UPI003A91FCE0